MDNVPSDQDVNSDYYAAIRCVIWLYNIALLCCNSMCDLFFIW